MDCGVGIVFVVVPALAKERKRVQAQLSCENAEHALSPLSACADFQHMVQPSVAQRTKIKCLPPCLHRRDVVKPAHFNHSSAGREAMGRVETRIFDDDENTLTLQLAFITQVREVKLFLGGFWFHAFWPRRSIHCWAPFHLRETLSKVTKPMHNSDQNRKPSIVTCARKSEMA